MDSPRKYLRDVTWAGKYLFAAISIITFVLCCLPLMMKLKFNDGGDKSAPIYKAMSSKEFEISLISCLAVAVPITIDFIIDVIAYSDTPHNGRSQRAILLLSLIIPDALIYALVVPNNDAASLVCIFHLRNALITYAVLKHLWEFGSEVFKLPQMLAVLTFFMAGHIFDTAGAFTNTNAVVYFYIHLGCFFIAFLIFLTLVYRWIRQMMQTSIREISDVSSSDLNINVFLLPAVAFGLGYVLLNIIYLGSLDKNTDTTFLTSFTYLEATFTVVVFLIQARFKTLETQRTQQETIEVKRVFVRFVSHEMRTPLNTAVMGLEILSTELINQNSDQSCLDLVEEVRTSCQSGLSILDDLLDYDKLEQGFMQLDRRLLSVWDLLEEVVQPFTTQARHSQITLELSEMTTESKEQLQDTHIYVDKGKLVQVMNGLLSNAIKCSNEGGQVIVSACILQNYENIGDDWFQIDVKDNGVGMSERDIRALFQSTTVTRNSQLDTSRLGLIIAQSFVELHGGNIYATSDGIGWGSTFTIKLPMRGHLVSNNGLFRRFIGNDGTGSRISTI